MTYHYVWLVWSSAFLLPWVLLYALFPQHRVAIWWASVAMAPFGLTEPIFAGAAMALSSVSVVTNALRLNRVKL